MGIIWTIIVGFVAGVIAKWLMSAPKVLIMDDPTRGIDVGAKAEIHTLITNLAARGKAIILVSSELPEILGMSDRVAVMREGRLTGIVERKDALPDADHWARIKGKLGELKR